MNYKNRKIQGQMQSDAQHFNYYYFATNVIFSLGEYIMIKLSSLLLPWLLVI